MSKKFKPGDFVFVKDKDGSNQSTKVWSVGKKFVTVGNWNVENDEYGNPPPVAVRVGFNRVQLQSDWEKEIF